MQSTSHPVFKELILCVSDDPSEKNDLADSNNPEHIRAKEKLVKLLQDTIKNDYEVRGQTFIGKQSK